MSPGERRTELVRRIQLTAVRARSIMAETVGLDIAELLDPDLYGSGPLSLVTVTEHMLEAGRTPAPTDVMNVLILAYRSTGFAARYAYQWGEKLPEPIEAIKEDL